MDYQLEEVLEHLYDGVVIVNRQGIVKLINQAYCDFLEVNKKDVIGRHINKTLPNSRMTIVMDTKESEIDSVMKVNDKDIIVRRTPIIRNGEVIGAIGKVMFTDINEVKALMKKLDITKNKLSYFKSELRKVRGAKYSFDNIIGDHGKILEAKELAKKVAQSISTVLLIGESGTGKELFAHAIHEASDRSDGPLIRVNCAAIPESIIESELFGYEEGAFTGAKKGGNPGKIEQADGGTLFLDEIGDMPLDMQAKILRILQEKEITRIGGKETKSINVRIIAATNKPLDEMVKEGTFREDLYYRLNVFLIEIPPLRERRTDIMKTAESILTQLNNDLGTNIKGFSKEVEEIFLKYQWPGNIRELQNVIERSLHMVGNESIIELDHLPPYLLDTTKISGGIGTLDQELKKVEKYMIIKALKMSNGNRAMAAELLGIHRTSLYRKMEMHGIQ